MQQFLLAMALSCTAFSFAACPFQNQSIQCAEQQALELKTYSMDQIEPLLPLLEKWVQRAFVQYPYLWLPAQETQYSGNLGLLTEQDAQVALVTQGSDVLGVATVVAFGSNTFKECLGESVVEKAKDLGFDPAKLLYVNYFLTAPEHLNEPHLVNMLYQQIVEYARQTGKTHVCYFEGAEKADHPLKPETMPVIEPWGHVIQGFTSMNLEADVSWPTIQGDGTVQDEVHVAKFFVKDVD